MGGSENGKGGEGRWGVGTVGCETTSWSLSPVAAASKRQTIKRKTLLPDTPSEVFPLGPSCIFLEESFERDLGVRRDCGGGGL